MLDAIHFYAICYLDPVGAVLSWNKGAEDITGYSSEQIIGESFARFYTAEDRQAKRPAEALRSASEETGYEQEAWRVRSDGTRFWAHVVMRAVRDEAGVIIGYLKVTRKASRQSKGASAADDNAVQSPRRDAVGGLAGKMAPAFNTVLTAVSCYSELARKRLKTFGPIDGLLNKASAAARRAAGLTAKLSACGRRKLRSPSPIDVAARNERLSKMPIAGLSPCKGRTALIVDDDPAVLETTAGLIGGLGYRTLTATSGREALGLLIEHPEVALVVADDALPEITGAQLAAQAERIRPGLGVLVVSGSRQDPMKESLGACITLLAKPLDLQQLSAALAVTGGVEAFRPTCAFGRCDDPYGRSRLAAVSLDREASNDR